MSAHFLRNTVCALVMSAAGLMSCSSIAGGISLAGTRIVYPAGQKQSTLSVRNTSDQVSFMVQSWVEQADGRKSQDFVVTPPLYVSGPGNENTLRIMYTGAPARTDRETLYYLNTKAIPSVDKKSIEGKNVLMLAAITRIKLFVRPAGLTPEVDKAPDALVFHRAGDRLQIVNPTPYYLTVVQIKAGDSKLADTMVPPKGSVSLPLKAGVKGPVLYRTINDFGAATVQHHAEIK
ncbi:fimbrial chaperone protein [Erwinia typographi]|uniref:Fimbrial chaperone protein n=1 Tax=Erwinia typographi TaxID=371042 RepID=A0A0A3YTA2_9GAMM|nr:fimbria/pilus periplasmic chaperone [Erwinia typographi]KGT88759.1 fimbrial chaperone protein [Erwinia typographi]